MRLTILFASLLLLPLGALTQSIGKDFPKMSVAKPVARLSYQSTGYLIRDQRSSGICFMLDNAGRYRIARLTKSGREIYEGTLSATERSQIKDMLKAVEFVKPDDFGSVLQQGAESFVAEFTQNEETKHSDWIDPDHKRPFPQSVARLIDWLQDFKTDDASRLPDTGLTPICPSWGESLHPQSAKLSCPSLK